MGSRPLSTGGVHRGTGRHSQKGQLATDHALGEVTDERGPGSPGGRGPKPHCNLTSSTALVSEIADSQQHQARLVRIGGSVAHDSWPGQPWTGQAGGAGGSSSVLPWHLSSCQAVRWAVPAALGLWPWGALLDGS